MKQIEIRLFGAFRNLTTEPSITLPLKENATVADIKKELEIYFFKEAKITDNKLINESALATEKEILSLTSPVTSDMKLAILPPVCGG